MKPSSTKGLQLILQYRVEHQIDKRPIVDRVAGIVFEVGVGRTPLVGSVAIAGAEQVMRADIVGLFLQLHELSEQRLAFGGIGVVDLVVADVVPVVGQLALPGAGINSDFGGLGNFGGHDRFLHMLCIISISS